MQIQPKKISAPELQDWLKFRSPKPVLVDVREADELEIALFPFENVHMPLSEASQWKDKLFDYLPSAKPVVVICHAGLRSWNFGVWLIEQQWDAEVWNLDGGIDAWSMHIDPNVPRY